MVLDLRELKKVGKTEESFYFSYQPEENLVDIPNAGLKGEINVNGTVELTGEHSAIVSGEVEFVIKGSCTRCLTETENAYIAEFDEECYEDGEYKVVNDRIDLGKIVKDTILMNIPVRFLCKEDCKGICSGCGVNLNEAQCKCKKEGK